MTVKYAPSNMTGQLPPHLFGIVCNTLHYSKARAKSIGLVCSELYIIELYCTKILVPLSNVLSR